VRILTDKSSVSQGAILGVDYGLKRVGLAVSDENGRLAVGVGWLEGLSGRSLARRIKAEADKRNAKLVVIGQPPEGARDSDRVAAGVDELTTALEKMGLDTERYDESYTTSTVLAERKKYGGKSSKPRGWIDEAAAILILQSYIDMLKSTYSNGNTESGQRSSGER